MQLLQYGMARGRGDLRDSRAHRARTDHGDCGPLRQTRHRVFPAWISNRRSTLWHMVNAPLRLT